MDTDCSKEEFDMYYADCIAYLEQETQVGTIPTLERMKTLLCLMGNPQENLRCIHVAGTNGKGSAVAMLSSILQENGYRVGMYTSPHLLYYNERIQINHNPISNIDFAKYITQIKNDCAKMADPPTLFEILTAAAFAYFADCCVDIVVLEVGLGGRYDATNTIVQPLLSLIMSVSIDHTAFLGNTISEIAYEKCGIIKKHCPILLYPQQQVVYHIAKEIAQTVSAPFYYEIENSICIHRTEIGQTVFSVKNDLICYENVKLPLVGAYQIQNCITVLNACAVLQKHGLSLSKSAILQGIAKTKWIGRMEFIQQKPLLLLDGAHNIDGITKLAETLPLYTQNKKITLLLGILQDKAFEAMIEKILPLVHQTVCTETGNHRKTNVSILQNITAKYQKPVFAEPDVEKAFLLAKQITKEQDMILCCGSLYLIGAIHSILQKDKENISL